MARHSCYSPRSWRGERYSGALRGHLWMLFKQHAVVQPGLARRVRLPAGRQRPLLHPVCGGGQQRPPGGAAGGGPGPGDRGPQRVDAGAPGSRRHRPDAEEHPSQHRNGRHTRSGRSFWVHHCGRLPPAGGGLLALLSGRPRGSEGRGLRHGGRRHPRQAARDGGGAHQGVPGPDAAPGGAVSRPEAETQHQRRRQSDGSRGSEAGPQTQSAGVQQEGGPDPRGGARGEGEALHGAEAVRGGEEGGVVGLGAARHPRLR
ncbi:hypothetical protein EYF80_053096 [Liparis tanakae]|uniref:Uncharacterized protein n=1 Tax=Liparis tanakae TaxID=230148 RepID=A0A4Z2F771_9TELE|nr:hypothetical protein EYF80_053096 [Liparis tanakae]